jgi:hypothetical protein
VQRNDQQAHGRDQHDDCETPHVSMIGVLTG